MMATLRAWWAARPSWIRLPHLISPDWIAAPIFIVVGMLILPERTLPGWVAVPIAIGCGRWIRNNCDAWRADRREIRKLQRALISLHREQGS